MSFPTLIQFAPAANNGVITQTRIKIEPMATALLLIDFQNDYFPGGKWELERVEHAVNNAAVLLQTFREQALPVVHVRHEFPGAAAPFFQPGSDGAKTHRRVAPHVHEPVVLKHEINGFQGTELKSVLDSCQVERLVICGAMSHMCIDGTTERRVTWV